MTLNVEGDPNSILNKWPLLLDTDSIRSIGIAWLFKENGKWSLRPRITGNESLFYNAVVFFRFLLPLGLFFSFRWSASSSSRSLLQTGIGWKLNGRFAILLRIQSDQTSAAGVSGPNVGQASGFNYGTH